MFLNVANDEACKKSENENENENHPSTSAHSVADTSHIRSSVTMHSEGLSSRR